MSRSATASGIIALLRAITSGRSDLPLSALTPAQAEWAVSTGLAPLLHFHTQDDPRAATHPSFELVLGATLAAKAITSAQQEAMREILDAGIGLSTVPTLLKGVSLRDQAYSQPYLRPMADLDFLVAPDAIPDMLVTLQRLGYRPHSQHPAAFYEQHHHDMPLYHPERDLMVEVHRGLFPAKSGLDEEVAFRRETVEAESEVSDLDGRPVLRLSRELQIVYLASHWAFELKVRHGNLLFADLLCLWKTAAEFDWQKILGWLDNSVIASHLYLVLTYLNDREALSLDPALLEEIGKRQVACSPVTLRVLHRFIDRHVVNGRPFRSLIGPRNAEIAWHILLSHRRAPVNLLRLPIGLLPGRPLSPQ